MKVEYWSDYACPFCYIGVTRLEKAIALIGAESDVELEMRAFELDPDAPCEVTMTTAERFSRKYGIAPEQVDERIEGISRMGREEGLDFDYAAAKGSNTLDAHRLTKFAGTKSHRVARELEKRLYHAYFAEGLVLADRATLLRIACECGLDANEVNEVLASDAFMREVREDEREAHLLGANAVPFFVFDKMYAMPGAADVKTFIDLLRRVMAASYEPDSVVYGEASEEDAGTCGPDGCGF